MMEKSSILDIQWTHSNDRIIDGVSFIDLNKNRDDRGWLVEIFRSDTAPIPPAMGYISHTEEGVVRGPHVHVNQTDFFHFVIGNFSLWLWDAREKSVTFGLRNHFFVYNHSVIIPPGVVHAYRSLSGGYVINTPDKLYRGISKQDPVDEIRLEGNLDVPITTEARLGLANANT